MAVHAVPDTESLGTPPGPPEARRRFGYRWKI